MKLLFQNKNILKEKMETNFEFIHATYILVYDHFKKEIEKCAMLEKEGRNLIDID